ncbi:MAG: YraN family protein [Gammaproteobacteria bacterium]
MEARIENFLLERGLTTLARNYSCRGGEIDLVMRERDVIVFVEVRFRRSARFGSAAESVDAGKRRRLILAAHHYLAHHPALADAPCRFDVVAVTGDPNEPLVDWIAGAFSA